jgi:hypothetical protein
VARHVRRTSHGVCSLTWLRRLDSDGLAAVLTVPSRSIAKDYHISHKAVLKIRRILNHWENGAPAQTRPGDPRFRKPGAWDNFPKDLTKNSRPLRELYELPARIARALI